MRVYVTKDDLNRIFTNYEIFDKFIDLLSKLGVLLNTEIHLIYRGGNDEHIH